MKHLCLSLLALAPLPAAAADPPGPPVLAHFMPWHQTPDVSGYWGWHWTMNHFRPDSIGADGRRPIASHFYPLTGPYDSEDEAILEYQVLLMRLSGIDGVLVDWYGMEDFADYAKLNRATHALFRWIERAGLKFALVYEDQTVKHMVNGGHLEAAAALEHGRRVMEYLAAEWFGAEAHLNLDGRPVLLNFGPQYFKTASEWTSMFSGISPAPLFFTLDNPLWPATAGAFPWPPMWMAGADNLLTLRETTNYLSNFYARARTWPHRVAGAFPGFQDIYREAGNGDGYGVLEREDGRTFRSTLRLAFGASPDAVQLVTWNDYGEGTVIEPTEEFGNACLEIVQEERKAAFDPGFPYGAADLPIPFEMLGYRRAQDRVPGLPAVLDSLFAELVNGDRETALALLERARGLARAAPGHDGDSWLLPVYPNPASGRASVMYRLPEEAEVVLSLCDARGRRVNVLERGKTPAGLHSASWDTAVSGAGVYVVRLEAGNRSFAVKYAVVR